MPASTQGLKFLAAGITAARREVNACEEAWDAEAKECEHCIGEGGDGLECRHPDPQDEDFFCYSDRCPLLREV